MITELVTVLLRAFGSFVFGVDERQPPWRSLNLEYCTDIRIEGEIVESIVQREVDFLSFESSL